jgi:dihydroxy-acid dehydratase
MLRATGLTDDDLSRPLIGVANTWIEIGPCNFHLRRLSERVKAGIRAAGATPLEFNTIAVSDGISMGTEGMKASLISREVIADSIELVARGHLLDAVVAIAACDKTNPGTVMALARLNLPSLMLYGGSIYPGSFEGRDVTILDVFEAVGAYAAGKLTAEQLRELEGAACPGAGACGGQYTANTMAMAIEILGLALMDSIENAIASIAATGGSTNGVLHLLAIAREAGVELDIDDFDVISNRTPLLADLKPGGRYVAKPRRARASRRRDSPSCGRQTSR